MDKKFLKCCFTGYRPAKFPFKLSGNDSDYVEFENDLMSGILDLISNGCNTFYTGMAMGFDIIAAEVVSLLKRARPNLNIKLVCVLPYENQGDSFGDFWREKYYNVMTVADEKIVISENYHKGCYQMRNKYMVDNCDIVLTWYDGKSGGTRNTINYALQNNRKVINICKNECENLAIQTVFELF